MPSSVLSSDSMHIGLLAAAAHAAATNSRFTIFYNPRASPFEFVIPLAKYVKAVFHTRVSVGMRFRMLFETEESSVRRYMGTITDISDLDPVRWPNSQWRSVKVGWDESTAGERPPRISLWEIEPLTTFPMYPSFFPLRLKRPWHPGLPLGHENEGTSFAWLRGDGGDRGLHSLNSQASSVGPLIQQRCEPLLMGNEYDRFHAMPAPALQDIRGGEFLKQQFLNYQQPSQYLHQSPRTPSLLLQQIVQQQQISHVQSQGLSDNHTHNFQHPQSPHLRHEQNRQLVQQSQPYEDNIRIASNPMQQHHSHEPSQLCEKLLFPDSSANLSSVLTPFGVQNMLGSPYSEGSTTTLNTRLGHPMISEQNQETWDPRFAVSQTTQFGSTGPGSITNSTGADFSTLPYTSSYIQNSLYGCLGESSGMLQNARGIDPPTTFVKVYKSGSVGRSLDISQFSNYEELREELGHMYGIEGQLEDPFRSGWQLLFVDREDDILLLGDDPWEQFVNSVWYIKILSPEDVQKMGKHGSKPIT